MKLPELSASPPEAVEALKQIEGEISSPEDRLNYWRIFTLHNEWNERIKRGLMPYHSHDTSDVFFRFTDITPYGDAIRDTGSLYDMAIWNFIHGERVQSQELFRLCQGKLPLAGALRFDEKYIRALNGDFQNLPIVSYEKMPDGKGPIIWLACDSKYLVFALPMVRSLQALSSTVVHLHVFNHSPRSGLCEGVGLSTEVCPANPGYYHAVRFIRLLQFFDQVDAPVWLMDVDGLFNRSPVDLFASIKDHDVALRIRPARFEPWNQLNACVVGFARTPGAHMYLEKVAQYIYHFRNALHWGIDQLAMFCVFEHLKPSVFCLDDKVIDYDYKPEGMIWCNSSRVKMQHIEALKDPSIKPERPVYFEKFREFSQP